MVIMIVLTFTFKYSPINAHIINIDEDDNKIDIM